ncbi:ABC transporter permease [Glycomyces rhizosphaerae]|uniref:Transport permease protein n=1 Tax=Glycomyces rhizosphaerae TaxID=2054422 RepID=A0ABV7PUR5_9ACTN
MTALAAPARPSTGRLVTDTAVITRRNLRHILRIPGVLPLSAVMPVIFILMFTYVFGGAVTGSLPPGAEDEYVNWLIPGLIAQFALFSGANTAAGMADDLQRGSVDRFRSLPMARLAVPAGRTIADLVRAVFTILVMLGVGALIGFRWQTSVLEVLAAIGVALAFAFSIAWMMVTLGLLIRSAEAVQAAVYMLVFPLGFTSAVFVPVETMPDWLQTFAAHQPVTVVANAMRGLMLGPDAIPNGHTVTGDLLWTLAWSAGLVILFAPLAVRAYRRA